MTARKNIFLERIYSTAEEVAARTGFGITTIWKWLRNGTFPALNLNAGLGPPRRDDEAGQEAPHRGRKLVLTTASDLTEVTMQSFEGIPLLVDFSCGAEAQTPKDAVRGGYP